MKRSIVYILLFPLLSFAQVSDDFSDGDFTVNPSWTGDTGHFKVSFSTAVPEGQRPALQLDAPAAGQSYLAVAENFSDDLEWRFWAKVSLNTSAGNFARVYLLSGEGTLTSPLSGYLLQLGGASDSIWFCRQDSLEIVPLFRLDPLFSGNTTNAFRFRVTRSAGGEWEFFADPEGGSNISSLGKTTDTLYNSGNHFGIFCQYTGSNLTKFYFDDFYAGPLVIDSLPPALLAAEVISPEEVKLTFDEAVTAAAAENTLNYGLEPGIGRPYQAIRMLDPEIVWLFFDTGMQSGFSYVLNIRNMEDLSGNVAGETAVDLVYYLPQPYDIFISEIMADPSPSTGLPEHEYLEMHNRCPFPVNLRNWSLQISSGTHSLPAFILEPGQFLVLTSQDGVPSFGPFIHVAGLPSFSLPNTGALIVLRDPGGKTMCSVEYDLSWYRDNMKADGGWSLEMISFDNPCLGRKNWSASADQLGGTPGRAFPSVLEPEGIRVEKVCCHSPGELEVFFSQSLDSVSASDSSTYRIGPAGIYPVKATAVPPSFTSVSLELEQNLAEGIMYSLTVEPGLCNCIREQSETGSGMPFALPDSCAPFDIVLNEILFNPLGDGVDYVEIFNRSEKAIYLAGILLASVRESPPNPPDTDFVALEESCGTLLPGAYLLVSSDQDKVCGQYHTENPMAFLDVSPMPAYNNEDGFCLLLDRSGHVIDGLHYREDMHHPLLRSFDGVALERISPDRPGEEPDNWHSAAETVGFGTPGYRNSQWLENPSGGSTFTLHPDIFSPDGDGIDDHLGISYTFDSPGKLVSIILFDMEGRRVRTLVNNESAGTTGIYSWDGMMDDRTTAPDGIYVVYMECLGMDGKYRRYKQACVLSGRLPR